MKITIDGSFELNPKEAVEGCHTTEFRLDSAATSGEDIEPNEVMISCPAVSIVVDRDELQRALRVFEER